MEHLLVSVIAHQREKNAKQVKKTICEPECKMAIGCFRHRLAINTNTKSNLGKVLVADEPVTSIVIEALE